MPKLNPCRFIAAEDANGTVYGTLRYCNRVTREFWFTTNPAAIDGERRSDRGERGAMDDHFDARELPLKYKTGRDPIQWVRAALIDGFDFEPITLKNNPPNLRLPLPLPPSDPDSDVPL